MKTLLIALLLLSEANALEITSNTNWSEITTGCTGGPPCITDNVLVKNGAIINIDVPYAECATLQLGGKNPNKGNGTMIFTTGSSLMVDGYINLGEGPGEGGIDMSAGGTLTCQGFNVHKMDFFVPGTGTIIITGSNSELPSEIKNFNNLIVSGNLDLRNNSEVDITGELNVTGTLDLSKTTIIFSGSSLQTISTTSFNNLTVDKSGSNLSLMADVTITGELNLVSGSIFLGDYTLTIGKDGSIPSGGKATSYIKINGAGVLRKNLDKVISSFFFPVGDTNNYSPIEIIFNKQQTYIEPGAYITASVNNTAYPLIDVYGDYIKRYWIMNSGGFTKINYFLESWYLSDDVVGEEINLKQYMLNQDVWIPSGLVDINTRRTYTSLNLTEMLPNTVITARKESNPLPIELLSFDAKVEGESVELFWTTATETNNAYFTVEKSYDAVNFISLAVVAGANNSIRAMEYSVLDTEPKKGINYYRLTQTDFDGKSKIFEPISLEYKSYRGQNNLWIYPNPASGDNVNIRLSGFEPDANCTMIITNIFGKNIYSQNILTSDIGYYDGKIEKILSPDTYFLNVCDNKRLCKKQKFIVQK
jgi:hypothetical protein